MNKDIKLPLNKGVVGAASKRQARVLFELKNGFHVTDVEVSAVWPQFSELPESDFYVAKEAFCYDNDHRVIVCEAGIFPYGKGQEIAGVLVRENGCVMVMDGYYLSTIHRGSLIFLRNKTDARIYVRKCCSVDIEHELSRSETTEILTRMSDEKIDLFIQQVWSEYQALQDEDTSVGGDWHWNDRDA